MGVFDLSAALQGFDGSAALFPLPGTVLFPHILLPLHIFEPRYRRMTRDALDGNRLIAIALLEEGADAGERNAPIHPVVCLGRITSEEELEDGRFALMLQGLARARVIRELDRPDLPYRMADLEILVDEETQTQAVDEELLRHELLLRYRKAFPQVNVNQVFQQLMASDVPMGVFCDVIAHSLQQDSELTQLVLAESNVKRRAQLLLEQIEAHVQSPQRGSSNRDYPPPFSLN